MTENNQSQTWGSQLGISSPVDQALESAPVIFVDGAVGLTFSPGLVRFNLYQDRVTVRPEQGLEQEQGVTRVVCARLIMTPKAMIDLQKWLNSGIDTWEDLEKSSLGTTPEQKESAD